MGLKDMLGKMSHKQKATLLTLSILGCLANPVYAADTNQDDVVKNNAMSSYQQRVQNKKLRKHRQV